MRFLVSVGVILLFFNQVYANLHTAFDVVPVPYPGACDASQRDKLERAFEEVLIMASQIADGVDKMSDGLESPRVGWMINAMFPLVATEVLEEEGDIERAKYEVDIMMSIYGILLSPLEKHLGLLNFKISCKLLFRIVKVVWCFET